MSVRRSFDLFGLTHICQPTHLDCHDHLLDVFSIAKPIVYGEEVSGRSKKSLDKMLMRL